MTSEKADEAQSRKKGTKPGPTQPILYSLKIGFFAGLIWGLIRWLATGLNFTSVTQAFLLDPFVPRKHLGGFYWQAAGLGMFIMMSMIAALLYIVLLKSLRGPWPGLWFGALWWAIIYAWVGPMIGAVPPLNQIGWSSIVTDFCLFLMWGLFIGFSISFEFHNEAEREPSGKSAGKSAQPSS
ncbi:YqhR family membrane protein [Cohnella sp. WQ 127256]|uniref:YqhR family membrane protein n=1 Tax=Cohnella sp. WQ 127256 TaxID=2938790 RepID=UPI0021184718|nr:YqhR family membrane protein [Cohnella sp. WQ 127256]